MKKITFILTLISFFVISTSHAQERTAKVGSKVGQVEIRDSNNNPADLPLFGEKHLLIFYPDPSSAGQNQEFTDHLEENHIESDNIHSFGVVNLKAAPLYPNSIIRSVIRKKEKKNNTLIYTDPNYILRDAWGLGNVKNQFVIIFVTKDQEIAFLKIGKMTEKDIEEFYRVVEKYK